MLAAFCWPTAFKLSYWDTVRCYVLLYWNILKLDWSISPTKGNRLLRLLWGAWFLWLTTIASGKWREVPRQLSKKTKRSQVFPKKQRICFGLLGTASFHVWQCLAGHMVRRSRCHERVTQCHTHVNLMKVDFRWFLSISRVESIAPRTHNRHRATWQLYSL